jgi:hypothetical protein
MLCSACPSQHLLRQSGTIVSPRVGAVIREAHRAVVMAAGKSAAPAMPMVAQIAGSKADRAALHRAVMGAPAMARPMCRIAAKSKTLQIVHRARIALALMPRAMTGSALIAPVMIGRAPIGPMGMRRVRIIAPIAPKQSARNQVVLRQVVRRQIVRRQIVRRQIARWQIARSLSGPMVPPVTGTMVTGAMATVALGIAAMESGVLVTASAMIARNPADRNRIARIARAPLQIAATGSARLSRAPKLVPKLA